MLKIREVIYAKVQTAHGTPATPTAGSDAVLCSNLAYNPAAAARMLERPVIKNTKGKLAQVYGGSLAEISFDVEIRGSGTAGTAPEINDLLVACGMAETIVASTSVTYTPATDNQQYVTIYYMQDGVRRILEDAVGTFSLNMEAGAIGMISFTFTGHHGTASDTAFGAGTFQSTVPVPVINGGFTIGGYSASVSKLAIDRGNQVVTPPDFNTADGFGQIRIADWDITGSFDPLATLLATKNWVNEWQAGTAQALTTGAIGSTAGNIYTVSCPAVSYRSIAQAEREAERAYEIGFGAAESSGDDGLSIIFQ
jgi:hypothetical protein